MTILKKMLTLDMAKKIAVATEEKAIENKVNIVISIYDSSGNLKYFQRMDNTSYGSIRISQLKAKTSASMPYLYSNDVRNYRGLITLNCGMMRF